MGMLTRLRRIYNFLLFHANILQLSYTFGNFYIIFRTNILIQCPVPIHVCCMFFVSQNMHIKRSPNMIKTHGDFFGIYVILGKRINARQCTRGPKALGTRPLPWGRLGGLWPPRKAVGALHQPEER